MAGKRLLPGEFRKSGLVTIEMDGWRPWTKRSRAGRCGAAWRVQERYIVDVHRIDGVWDIEIEHDGVVTKIPGAVFDRITDYRKAIITEGRKRRGREQAESRANGHAAEDAYQALEG